MERVLIREWLDELPVNDSRAIHSRRDLCRINAWMGNAGTMARALRESFQGGPPQTIADLGAGDGEFLLSVARRLSARWKNTTLTLVDRQESFNGSVAKFEEFGWPARAVVADVFDWVKNSAPESAEGLVANLFLHHFSEAQLAELFGAAARTALAFIAVEPRRSRLPLICSRLLRLIGCNAVTRHDAVISVRAGFTGRELSALWPDRYGWHLVERPAGLFSHLFIARRKC